MNHKSAEPINVGEAVTSDTPTRPASDPVMSSNANRRLKPRQSVHLCQRGSGQGSRKAEGEPACFSTMQARDEGESLGQPTDATAESAGPSPYGVESGSTTGQGKLSEPGNPLDVSFGMAKATGDHDQGGRSLHSSPRTGKPSTRRRQAVNTASTQEEGPPGPGPMNIGFLLNMQRKLYCWSRNDPEQVFSDLFNLVCDWRNLLHAWQQLSRNQGSRTPGIDGLTRRKIEERPGGVLEFLEGIRKALRDGTYQPQPVRQRLIPKPGKPGKFRPLGIPTLSDRLVQMALKNVLEPIFEADFYPTSYGFRRGRSTLDALVMIQRHLDPNKAGPSKVRYIIEGDIKGCFDNIDHHLLMQRVRRRVGDKKVLHLILAFLKAGILAEGNIRHPVAGTPQGGIISPLLANIHLAALEERYRRWIPGPQERSPLAQRRRLWDWQNGRPTFFLVRYADDFVILVTGNQEEADKEKAALAEFLQQQLHLELSPEKTLVTRAEEGFNFLGYRVVKEVAQGSGRLVGKLRIPKGNLQLLRHRVKRMTDRSTTGQSLDELLKTLNPLIAGWRNYYRYATGAWKDFMRLDRWLWQRIRLWLKKKHRGLTDWEIRQRFARRETATRWTWGDDQTLLRRFGQGGTARYRCRGTQISNGWNDEIDDVHFYPEVTRPISGYTWVGESLR
jgi:RNA-directed DNA polymerase